MSTVKAFVHCSSQGLMPRSRDWNRDFQAVFDADAISPEQAGPRNVMLRELEAELVAFTSRVARSVVESRMCDPPLRHDDAAPGTSATPLPDAAAAGDDADDANQQPRAASAAGASDTSGASSSGMPCPEELTGFPGCFRVGNLLVRAWPNERQAKQYVHSLRIVVLAQAPGLHVPLTVLVSYCGITFTGQAIVPLGRRATVVYRGDGKPDPTPVNGLVHSAVKIVTDTANCLVEVAAGSEQHKLAGLEVQQGLDGRFYVVTAVGLLPPVHADVDNGPIRRFESLTIVDVPAAPTADRSHATEMGVVLLFRAVAQVTTLRDVDRAPALVDAMRKVGLNLAFLGVAAALIPDEDSLQVEQRAAALGVICVEILARAVKSLLYAELSTQFQSRRIEALQKPVGNALELVTTIDEKKAKKRLMPVIVRKFFANKRLPSSSPVHAALLSTRMSKRRLIVSRVCELAGLELPAPSAPPVDGTPLTSQDHSASPNPEHSDTGSSTSFHHNRSTSGGLVPMPTVDVQMRVISGRVSILPAAKGPHADEATLKGIVCPPRLFSFGLPRVVRLQLASGNFAEALSNANLVLADRKQRYGRATVPYALSSLPVATSQLLTGRADGGIALFHEALLALHRAARDKECSAGTAGLHLFVVNQCIVLGNTLLHLDRAGSAYVQFKKAAELITELVHRHAAHAPFLGLVFAALIVGVLECIRRTHAKPLGNAMGGSTIIGRATGARATSPATNHTGTRDDFSSETSGSQNNSRQSSMRGNSVANLSASPNASRMGFAKTGPGGSGRTPRSGTPQAQSLNATNSVDLGASSRSMNNSTSVGPGSPRDLPTLAPWVVALGHLMIRAIPADDGVYQTTMQLAEACMEDGMVDEASRLLTSAVSIAVATFGHVSEEHATALAQSALALSKVSFDENAPTCREMLTAHVEIVRSLYGDVSGEHAGALNNIGTLFMLSGKYADAAGYFWEALRVYTGLGIPEDEGGHGVARRNAAVLQARMMMRAAVSIQKWYRRRQRRRAAEQPDDSEEAQAPCEATSEEASAAANDDSVVGLGASATIGGDDSAALSGSTSQRAGSQRQPRRSDEGAPLSDPGRCDGDDATPPPSKQNTEQPLRRHDQSKDSPPGAGTASAARASADETPENAPTSGAPPADELPLSKKPHQHQQQHQQRAATPVTDDAAHHAAKSQTAAPAEQPPTSSSPTRPRREAEPEEEQALSEAPTPAAAVAPDATDDENDAADTAAADRAKHRGTTRSKSPALSTSRSPATSPRASKAPSSPRRSPRAAAAAAAASPSKASNAKKTPSSPSKKSGSNAAPTTTHTGRMPVSSATAQLQRAGRAYLSRVVSGESASEARAAKSQQAREAVAAAARREQEIAVATDGAQRLARALCSRLVMLRRAVGPLARFVVGFRARATLANVARARVQQRLRAATSKLLALETAARDDLSAQERKESKANFDQLMVIRRLQRNERQRRLERQEFMRTIKTKKLNLEDDERGHRHAIENEATYLAAQLQRSIREKIRTAQRRQKERTETADADHASSKRTEQPAPPPGLPPLAGSGRRKSAAQHHHGSRPATRESGRGCDDGDRAEQPLQLADLDHSADNDSTPSHNGQAATSAEQSSVAPLAASVSAEPEVRFQGFVLDDEMAAMLRDEAELRRMQQRLTKQLLAIDSAVDDVRAERDAVQASMLDDSVSSPPQRLARGPSRPAALRPALAPKPPPPFTQRRGTASPQQQRQPRAAKPTMEAEDGGDAPAGAVSAVVPAAEQSGVDRGSARRAKSEGNALSARRHTRPMLPMMASSTPNAASSRSAASPVSAAGSASARRQSAAAVALQRLSGNPATASAALRRSSALPEVFSSGGGSPTSGGDGPDWSQSARKTRTHDHLQYLKPARRTVL